MQMAFAIGSYKWLSERQKKIIRAGKRAMGDSKPYLCKATLFAITFFALFLHIGCGGSQTVMAPSGQNPQSPQSGSISPASNPSVAASSVPYQKEVDLDLTSSTAIPQNAAITIANHGKDPIVMPGIFIQGDSALNRSSILYPLQALKDEQFALATWQFVVNHTQHYCEAGAPGDSGDTAAKPLRLLNGFGFMCCDQSSRILNWLWQGAGYQTRIVSMSFHVVPEIYYGGNWHMFDADHKVYYLAEDNITVASVADVIADPNLVARTADA